MSTTTQAVITCSICGRVCASWGELIHEHSCEPEQSPEALGLCAACLSSGRDLDEAGLCSECDGHCPHCGARDTRLFEVEDDDPSTGYNAMVTRCEGCLN